MNLNEISKNENSLVDAMDLDELRTKTMAERDYEYYMADLLDEVEDDSL